MNLRTPVVLALSLSMGSVSGTTSAAVIGFLGNFDVINDTGQTAHGFEIELEGLHVSDITDVFGGPGRGFPDGRGFDPANSVERYGAPTITAYTNASGFGTKVTYYGIFGNGSWDYGTPSVAPGTFVTPGDNCWSGGGLGYNELTPCDHFGVGTSANPTKTTYSWLFDNPANPGTLIGAQGTVSLPAPAWTVIPAPPPPPGEPPAPPIVVAKIEAPAPDAYEFGDALWVKIFTTELENEVELEQLVAGDQIIEDAVTETEWQLLQKEAGKPNSGQLESGNLQPVGAKAESIIRRYEYYKFSGAYDPDTHEARFDAGFGDTNPGPDDVGSYIGAQNAAALLDAAVPQGVPEPNSLALLLSALGVSWISRRNPGHDKEHRTVKHG